MFNIKQLLYIPVSKKSLIAYCLVIISLIFLDHSTKFHAEKNFMTWFDPADVNLYHNNKKTIFNLGISHNAILEQNNKLLKDDNNWLDVNFTYVRNQGAAWGILSNVKNSLRIPFFIIITFLALGAIYSFFKSSQEANKIFRLSLLFIVGGALGNFIDRVYLTYVIDFIHFHWKIFSWEVNFPVFNIADISINIGFALFVLDLIIQSLKKRQGAMNVEQNKTN